MKTLRAIRILLAALFFAASAACLLIGPQAHPMAAATPHVQITLSALSITAGATLVWLLLTFIFGRVYCSTACPIGFFSDIFFRLGRKIPYFDKEMKYRHKSRASIHILWIYGICLVAGIVAVPFIIEPWNIARNMTTIVNHDNISATWASVGLGLGSGIIAGVVSALFIGITSLWRGREFCTRYCPLGTAMGLMSDHTLYHIEIDHDSCDACGLCEAQCRASCIKTVSRYVDNSRCVRCLDCVANCPREAIRLQTNRNRPATPLMKKKSNCT